MIPSRRDHHPDDPGRPDGPVRSLRTAGGVELTDPVVAALSLEAEAGYDPAVLRPRLQSMPVEAFTARWHAARHPDGGWCVSTRPAGAGGLADPDALVVLRADMPTIAVYVAYLHNHLIPEPDAQPRPAACTTPMVEEAA